MRVHRGLLGASWLNRELDQFMGFHHADRRSQRHTNVFYDRCIWRNENSIADLNCSLLMARMVSHTSFHWDMKLQPNYYKRVNSGLKDSIRAEQTPGKWKLAASPLVRLMGSSTDILQIQDKTPWEESPSTGAISRWMASSEYETFAWMPFASLVRWGAWYDISIQHCEQCCLFISYSISNQWHKRLRLPITSCW